MFTTSVCVIFGQVFNLGYSSSQSPGAETNSLFRNYGLPDAIEPVTHKLVSDWMWAMWKVHAIGFD